MEVRRRWQARTSSLFSLRKGDFQERPPAEHPPVEQGPRGDSEASARGGLAVSDADREPAAQVRSWAPQGDLKCFNSPLKELGTPRTPVRVIRAAKSGNDYWIASYTSTRLVRESGLPMRSAISL